MCTNVHSLLVVPCVMYELAEYAGLRAALRIRNGSLFENTSLRSRLWQPSCMVYTMGARMTATGCATGYMGCCGGGG